jgi:hypothetical protein
MVVFCYFCFWVLLSAAIPILNLSLTTYTLITDLSQISTYSLLCMYIIVSSTLEVQTCPKSQLTSYAYVSYIMIFSLCTILSTDLSQISTYSLLCMYLIVSSTLEVQTSPKSQLTSYAYVSYIIFLAYARF